MNHPGGEVRCPLLHESISNPKAYLSTSGLNHVHRELAPRSPPLPLPEPLSHSPNNDACGQR